MTDAEQFAFNKAKALALHDYDANAGAPVTPIANPDAIPSTTGEEPFIDENGMMSDGSNIGTPEDGLKLAAGTMSALSPVLSPVTTIANAIGMPKGPALSNAIPGAYAKPGPDVPWYQPEKGGLLDPTIGGTITGVADLFTPGVAGKLLGAAGGGMKGLAKILSGLTDPSAEMLAKNPDAVKGLAQMLRSGETSGFEDATAKNIKDTQQLLGQKGGFGDVGKINASVQGTQIPIPLEHLQALAPYDENAANLLKQAQGKVVDVAGTGGKDLPVEGVEANRLRMKAGQLAYDNGQKNALTGAHIADDPALAAANSNIRSSMTSLPDVGSDIDATIKGQDQSMKIQRELSSYLENPTSIFTKNNVGKNATIDRLAKVYNLPELQNQNQIVNAANEINGVHSPYGGIQMHSPVKGVISSTANKVGQNLLPKSQAIIDAAGNVAPGFNPYNSLIRAGVNDVNNSQ